MIISNTSANKGQVGKLPLNLNTILRKQYIFKVLDCHWLDQVLHFTQCSHLAKVFRQKWEEENIVKNLSIVNGSLVRKFYFQEGKFTQLVQRPAKVNRNVSFKYITISVYCNICCFENWGLILHIWSNNTYFVLVQNNI